MEIIAAKEQFLLRINVTTAEDAEGNYTCVASNRVGTDSAFSLLRSGIGEFSELVVGWRMLSHVVHTSVIQLH